MIVHPRIHERHPEIDDMDVVYAWEHCFFSATREVAARELRLGFDLKGRELEMVGVLQHDGWFVYHAMTPPSAKTYSEMEKAYRRL